MTPLAYEPSGFEAVADVDLARFKYEHITLRCGQASTGHHTIALKARMIDNEAKGLKEADNPAFETPVGKKEKLSSLIAMAKRWLGTVVTNRK